MERSLHDPVAIPLGFGRRMRVLLVEDDPDQAQLAYALVNGCVNGPDLFHIEWKDNILQAISRLAKPGIDVVLLDLGMLELSGYKTHLAIMPVTKKTPVVIFTSDDSAVSQDITTSQGAFRYLLKNRTSPVELRQALHEAAFSAPL
jgi:CheY-like chemotaxis protein